MPHTMPEIGPDRSWAGPSFDPSCKRGMTPEEIRAVVARNSVGCIHHALADGAIRTHRVRYARDGGVLYIPAWTSVDSWYAVRVPRLECDVSEVDHRSCWRYARLIGQATPLQPTGGASERDAWRHGVGMLRRVLTNMAAADELAVANFCLVRMEIETWDGVLVPLGEDAERSSLFVTHL